MRGQTFEVLAVRNNWGGDRVSYQDEKGRLRTVPVEWTDIHTPDPAITIGAGRAIFRADLLRQLRRLIDEQRARRVAEQCYANYVRSVFGIMCGRHFCLNRAKAGMSHYLLLPAAHLPSAIRKRRNMRTAVAHYFAAAHPHR